MKQSKGGRYYNKSLLSPCARGTGREVGLKLIPACFLLIGVCSLYIPAAGAADWQKLTDGIQYKKLSVNLGEGTASLNVLKLNLDKVTIKPVVAEQSATAREFAQRHQAVAVINANFFDPDGKPLGLVKFDRKIINPKKNISWWSVFCIKKDRAQIIHTQDIKDGYCDQAVQAGPRLVINGTIPKLKNELTRKSAVGINSRGEVLFVVSTQPIPIKNLAETFKKSEADGGLDCPNALNLDGGSSSQMYVQAGKVKIDVGSFVRVPVALAAFHK